MEDFSQEVDMSEHKKQSKTIRFLQENTLVAAVLAIVVLAIPVAIVSNSENESRDSFAQTVPTPTPKIVNVSDYGTDTAAIQNAANAAADGILVFPSNATYTITSTIKLPNNIVVQGNGSTLKTQDNTPSTQTHDSFFDIQEVTNVEIYGFTFDNNVDGQRFWSQHRHALRLYNASYVKIHDNTFVNLIGDGIYISNNDDSGEQPPYKGSSNVDIYNNQFLGAHKNRNGISIICGKDIKIHDNTFIGMSRPDMPGSIDLESNFSTQFLYNIEVYGNRIENGDSVSTSTDRANYGILYWGPSNPQANNISFHHNTILGGQVGFKHAGIVFGGANAATVATGLQAYNNDITNAWSDIELDFGITVTITNNTLSNGGYGYGIQNYYACLIHSGNIITNVYQPITETGPTCSAPTATTAPTAIPTAVPTATSVPTPTRTPTPSDTTPPSVSITSPLNNTYVTRGRVTTILASASDNFGVKRVEFYVNNVLKCTDTTATYSCAWSVPSAFNKQYTLTAKAYDAAGNSKLSTSITVYAK